MRNTILVFSVLLGGVGCGPVDLEVESDSELPEEAVLDETEQGVCDPARARALRSTCPYRETYRRSYVIGCNGPAQIIQTVVRWNGFNTKYCSCGRDWTSVTNKTRSCTPYGYVCSTRAGNACVKVKGRQAALPQPYSGTML